MKRLGNLMDGYLAIAFPAKRGALLVAWGLAFAGCESIPFTLGSKSQDTTQEGSERVLTGLPDPKPFPPKPKADKPAQKAAVMAVGPETPLPVEKPPVTTLSENQIVGAQSAQLRNLIGQPERVVTNAPSQTWYYAGGPCRFSVQFFKDLDSGEYRALKYSVDGGSLERCLAQFERFNEAAPIEAQTDFIKQGTAQSAPTSG